jgi:hypothetical protein
LEQQVAGVIIWLKNWKWERQKHEVRSYRNTGAKSEGIASEDGASLAFLTESTSKWLLKARMNASQNQFIQ